MIFFTAREMIIAKVHIEQKRKNTYQLYGITTSTNKI
jgi:hypothetical protein